MNNQTFLTPEMFAAKYHLSPRWLARRRHERTRPAYIKCGKQVLYAEQDLLAYLGQSTVSPSSPA